MIDRRTFLKTAAALGGAVLLNPIRTWSSLKSSSYFGVHPFIEHNPNAVFIMHTSVDVKTNEAAKLQAGLDFGRSVFALTDNAAEGVPLSHKFVIKPNLTCRGKWQRNYSVEGSMGVVTDAFFVEGIIEGIKERGIAGDQFYLREVNCPEDFEEGGYWDMSDRTGAEIRDLSARVGSISENDLQWMEVPEGVWFRKIPYLWPVNAPETFFLNIAKFKAHGMGLTLCAKNLQGTIAHYYQQHCASYTQTMDMAPEHMNPAAKTDIMDNYNRHVADGIPRWDKPGNDYYGGLGQETWASRCLDNNTVSHPNLHIIEGIYGRDGNFMEGPGPGGMATDYMTNIIIFGKNPFHVDIIGHWLGGHEPGNFGLFHLALERGLSSVLNPMAIPVYEWKADATATLTPLANFNRTPLKTYYLQRDYNGQTEPKWHLCDESFDYSTVGIDLTGASYQPNAFVLRQNYPNPFNPVTSIEYSIPKNGHVLLEIFNVYGDRVEVLAQGYQHKGQHLAVWHSHNFASGMYFYRFSFAGFSKTRRMLLVK